MVLSKASSVLETRVGSSDIHDKVYNNRASHIRKQPPWTCIHHQLGCPKLGFKPRSSDAEPASGHPSGYCMWMVLYRMRLSPVQFSFHEQWWVPRKLSCEASWSPFISVPFYFNIPFCNFTIKCSWVSYILKEWITENYIVYFIFLQHCNGTKILLQLY